MLLPPTSTLFPYTTLFRSHRLGPEIQPAGQVHRLGVARPPEEIRHGRAADAVVAVDDDLVAGIELVQAVLDLHDGDIDRKSTRLNSSHSQISYAVFCLKKK